MRQTLPQDRSGRENNDDKPEIQLSAVNSNCFPFHCDVEGGFGACIIRILIHFTCDSRIFARFRYFEFRVESSVEPEVVLQNLVYGSIIITGTGGDSLCMLYTVFCDIPM